MGGDGRLVCALLLGQKRRKRDASPGARLRTRPTPKTLAVEQASARLCARAMDGGVPHGERASGVVLPDPGMQGVEGWQAEAVAVRRQHEGLAKELGRRLMRGVPLGLEGDVFDGDQTRCPFFCGS